MNKEEAVTARPRPVRGGDEMSESSVRHASGLASALCSIQTVALFATTLLAASLAGVGVLSPATANAYATIAPPPIPSTAPGLPDGRVYEQVSPADKNGNQAGAGTNHTNGNSGFEHYGAAAGDGNSLLFEGTGPMGEAAAAYSLYFVAQRSAAGWTTRATEPRARQSTAETGGTLRLKPFYVDPSSDLTHVMFESGTHGTYAQLPNEECTSQIYLSALEPFTPARWLERPAIPNPVENCQPTQQSGAPVGGTPDFSTVYFTYPGTLLPEDASRVPHTQPERDESTGSTHVEAWGFYEDVNGALREAGVLPDDSLDPFGAVPAAGGHARALSGNQVSADGSRAFFVSPDPASCGHQNNCAVDPPELYVRDNGDRTLLVSRDTLLPAVGGLPASAPDGAFQMLNPTHQFQKFVYFGAGEIGSFVFASPDGSQAFFQSEDKLTADAPEGPPGSVTPKTYDFDLETEELTYLPNVAGQIVVASSDGSSFAFVRPEVGASPAEMDLWSAGANGGTVTPVTQLTGHPPELEEGIERLRVPSARMSSDGSVIVFTSPYRLPGGFNSGTNLNLEQIYRYDIPAKTLGCASCPPVGVVPTGDAVMSPLGAVNQPDIPGMVDERGISSDGDRIFFDSPDPLVPQDVNTGSIVINTLGEAEPQGRDVYEWENGIVYLVSSGKSPRSSFFLDNSASGGDAFFTTTEGLVSADTDGAYDVYDARIPHPGDSPPPAAVPCQGSVCQGPPRVPAPLGAPASATFSGLGNVAPEPAAKSAVKPKPRSKPTKCRKGYLKKRGKGKCVKRLKKHTKKSNGRGK
jgi:hypothetical protein